MLCIAAIVAFLDRQIINLLVEPIKSDLGISDTQISLLQGFAFALFYSIVAIPLGRLVDTNNRKKIIAVGMVLWSLATMLCGVSKIFIQLFFARMFVGIGEATLSPAGMSIIADYFCRKTLTRALSVFNGSGFFGSGIALVIGGLVINQLMVFGDLNFGVLGIIKPWQLRFIVVALPGLFFVLVIWFFLDEPQRVSSGFSGEKDYYSIKDAWLYLIINKKVLGSVILGFTFLAMMIFALVAWIPTYFIRTHGTSISEIANILGLYFMVFGTAGVICGGIFSDWLKSSGYYDSNLRAGCISALVCLPFVIFFPLVDNYLYSIILLAPVIFFGTMPFGTGPSALPLLVPNRLRGQMVAIYLFSGNLIGQGCGPWLVAAFTDFILNDPSQIRYSLSIVCPVIGLMGCAILFFGMKPFGVYIKELDSKSL